MRIFDPKDQFGNSLLSQAETQKSSVKLEKQMAVGGAITLTSTDISDIENWELSNARVKVDGQMISFLPDTSRDGDGNLVITLGETFSDVVLVLKRTVFDGMKQEEEDIIEVEIRQLMAKTMAAATAPTTRTGEQIQENINEWKAMGVKAYTSDPVKYANATRYDFSGYEITGEGEVVVDDSFLSVDTLSVPGYDHIVVTDTVTAIRWHADLPSLKYTASGTLPADSIIEWTGKIPNIIDATGMFMGCSRLTSWTVELPNSLEDASLMFQGCSGLESFSTPSGTLPSSLENAFSMFDGCTGLRSWTVALPNSLTYAQNMFNGCTGLREFTPSLAGLTNCENFGYMFGSCKLNEASIRNVLTTLPSQAGKTKIYLYSIGCDAAIDQATRNTLSSLAQQVSREKNYYITLSWNS